MNLKLKKCIREDQSGCHDCFNLKVKITYDHSHEVESTEFWNFQEVGESARLRLLELFEDRVTPARAKYIKGQSQFKRHSFLNYFPFIQTDILLSSAFISFILSAHRVLSTR